MFVPTVCKPFGCTEMLIAVPVWSVMRHGRPSVPFISHLPLIAKVNNVRGDRDLVVN